MESVSHADLANKLLKLHGGVPCMGLKYSRECDECGFRTGNRRYGMNLSTRMYLLASHPLWQDDHMSESGFNPSEL